MRARYTEMNFVENVEEGDSSGRWKIIVEVADAQAGVE